MMGRVYGCAAVCGSVTSAQSLMTIQAPADMVIELISAEIVSYDNDTNEQMDISLKKITTYGSPAGTSVTPSPFQTGDAASTAVVLADLTAEPTTYATEELIRMGASSLGGWRWAPASDERIYLSPSEAVGFYLETALGTSNNLSVQAVIKEIGG